MRFAASLVVFAAIAASACSGPAKQPASSSTPKPTAASAEVPMDSSDWVSTWGGSTTPVIIVQDPSEPRPAQIDYPAAPNIPALAGQVADAAAAQWRKNSPTLPEPADLKLLLQTTLDALITPNFDTYDKLLTSRDAKLTSALAASADDLHNRNDLGVPSDEWSLFSNRQKSRAYWNAAAARGARWKDVVLADISANTGMDTVPERTGYYGMSSFAVYQGPGGTDMYNAWSTGDAPIAHVYFPAILSSGKKGLTFFFGFDEHAKKWYPYCLRTESFDGRGFSMRI